FAASLPLYYNSRLDALVTAGLEIEAVVTKAVVRATRDETSLVADEYQFVANEDTRAIHHSLGRQLLQYIEVSLEQPTHQFEYSRPTVIVFATFTVNLALQ